MTEIQPTLVLACSSCRYRPPPNVTVGVVRAHMIAEHGAPETDDGDLGVNLDLVAVCSCATIMDLIETRSPNVGVFYDYFRCPACGNTGRIRRTES